MAVIQQSYEHQLEQQHDALAGMSWQGAYNLVLRWEVRANAYACNALPVCLPAVLPLQLEVLLWHAQICHIVQLP